MHKIDFGLAQKKKNMGGKDQLFVYFELEYKDIGGNTNSTIFLKTLLRYVKQRIHINIQLSNGHV